MMSLFVNGPGHCLISIASQFPTVYFRKVDRAKLCLFTFVLEKKLVKFICTINKLDLISPSS